MFCQMLDHRNGSSILFYFSSLQMRESHYQSFFLVVCLAAARQSIELLNW